MNLTRAQQLFVGVAVLAIVGAVTVGVRGRHIKAKASVREDIYTAPPQPAAPASVTVQVAGAVNDPGLKVLPRGARVNDAVQAAGGPAAYADMARVNLAAPVDDGQRIDIPSLPGLPLAAGTPPAASADDPPRPSQPLRPLNINTATAEQLQALPGLGPALAQAIVDYRHQVGAFRRVEDLEAVPGIGPKRLADIRPYLSVQ